MDTKPDKTMKRWDCDNMAHQTLVKACQCEYWEMCGHCFKENYPPEAKTETPNGAGASSIVASIDNCPDSQHIDASPYERNT